MRLRLPPLLLAILLLAVTGTGQVTAPKPEDTFCTVQGTVLDADSGKPLKSAQVRLNETDAKSPRSYRISTDIEGKFIIKNIAPGRYRFSATKNGYVTQQYRPENSVSAALLTLSPAQKLDRVLFRMTPAAVIAGRITDEDGEPLSGVVVMAMVRANIKSDMLWRESRKQIVPVNRAVTNDLGEYRLFGLRAGKYYVAADDAGESGMIDLSGGTGYVAPVRRFPPTFYPGTVVSAQAEQLQVRATEEIRADFTLQPAKLYEIKGRVISANGEPVSGAWIFLSKPGSVTENFFGQNFSSIDSEGSFTISGIYPGTYELVANSNGRDRQLSASLKIDVTDHDLSDVRLVLTRGITVSGRILTDDGQRPPANVGQYLMLASHKADWGSNTGDQIKADGSFSISGLRPGEFRVRIFQLPDGWYIKSIRFGDQDVTDAPLKIEQGMTAANLEIRVANDAGRIEGAVQLKEKPAPGATVLVLRDSEFDEEPNLIKADQNGMYVARNLRPGRYHIMAAQRDEEDFESDYPEADEVRKNGETIELGPRGTKSMTLKLKPKPDENATEQPSQ